MNNDWIKEMQEKFVNHGEFLYNRGSYPATFGEVKQFIQSLLDKQIEEICNFQVKVDEDGKKWIDVEYVLT